MCRQKCYQKGMAHSKLWFLGHFLFMFKNVSSLQFAQQLSLGVFFLTWHTHLIVSCVVIIHTDLLQWNNIVHCCPKRQIQISHPLWDNELLSSCSLSNFSNADVNNEIPNSENQEMSCGPTLYFLSHLSYNVLCDISPCIAVLLCMQVMSLVN